MTQFPLPNSRSQPFRSVVFMLTLVMLVGLVRSASAAAIQDTPGNADEAPALGGWLRTTADLAAPEALAMTADGRIFICESGAHRVRVIDANGQELLRFGSFGRGAGQFDSPAGIACSPDGRVFVSDTGNHRIQVFDQKGRFKMQFASPDIGEPGAILGPLGLAASDSHVAVAESGRGRVLLFNAQGVFQRAIAERGTGPGQLLRPRDVVFDDQDRLYVADADRHRILVFDLSGKFLHEWGDWGYFPGLFSEPVAIDFAIGQIYVADRENHRVQVFTPQGRLVHKWGLHSILPREGAGKMHYPSGLAVAQDGSSAALVEPFDDRLQLFGARDEREQEEINRYKGAGQASSHYGFEMHAAGRYMAIVEPETHSLTVFAMHTETPILISKIGGYGRDLGLFMRPAGLWIDEHERTLLVCERGARRLQFGRLDVDPDAELGFDPNMMRWSWALDLARFTELQGLTLDWPIDPLAVTRTPLDEILLLDAANASVHMLSAELDHVRSFGSRGDGADQLRRPTALACRKEPAGHVQALVVDAGHHRVQVFDPATGARLSTFGTGHLQDPFGIVVDAQGSVYVTDVATHSVLCFDRAGELQWSVGREGLGRLEFFRPRSIAIDHMQRLIVIDHANHRGILMDTDGAYLGAFGSRFYTKPARLPHTYDPAEYGYAPQKPSESGGDDE